MESDNLQAALSLVCLQQFFFQKLNEEARNERATMGAKSEQPHLPPGFQFL